MIVNSNIILVNKKQLYTFATRLKKRVKKREYKFFERLEITAIDVSFQNSNVSANNTIEYRFYNFIEKLQVEFKQNIYNGEFDPGSG